GRAKILLKNEGDYIISEFSNYAPNLEASDIDKVFERFYIGDKSRSKNSTGLGLSLTKNLVEKMGHEIESRMVDNNFVITIKWLKS
ncbi:MAG: sensor histidine kinase, partial [Peptostreptococcaceae bacterium]